MSNPEEFSYHPERATDGTDQLFYQSLQIVHDDIRKAGGPREYFKYSWEQTHRQLALGITCLVDGYAPEVTHQTAVNNRKTAITHGLIIGSMVAKNSMNGKDYSHFARTEADELILLHERLLHAAHDLPDVLIHEGGYDAARRLLDVRGGLIVNSAHLTDSPNISESQDIFIGAVGYMVNKVLVSLIATENPTSTFTGRSPDQEMLDLANLLQSDAVELTSEALDEIR